MELQKSWIIRPVEARDVITIANHRYFNENESASDKAHYVSWVEAAIVRKAYLGLVATFGEETIASAGLVILDWGPTRGSSSPLRGRIVNVFTASSWRRRGISGQLITQLLADARKCGVGSFCLGATAEAKALYESLGFKDYGHEMLLK